MADELDKKKVTALSELTTTSDNDLYITGEGGQAPLRKITFATIAAGILNKLSTWTFSALNTTTKTLTGAINELNSSLPFRGISNTLTSQYPTLYSYITAVGKTRDVYLYDWWNNNMFSDMPTRKSATNCAVTIDYHNGASDKVYGTVLVTYTWTDGSYQQFLGKITQSSSTSITWIELPNRSEITALNSKIASTNAFQMTYIQNSYTTKENTDRCRASKFGKFIVCHLNLGISVAIPNGTEVPVGYFAGIHCNGESFQQVPHQGDPSHALMFKLSNVTDGIQLTVSNYNNSGLGSAPAGFYRVIMTAFTE